MLVELLEANWPDFVSEPDSSSLGSSKSERASQHQPVRKSAVSIGPASSPGPSPDKVKTQLSFAKVKATLPNG